MQTTTIGFPKHDAYVAKQQARNGLQLSTIFVVVINTLLEKETKNQWEGINTPNCPAAKKHSKPRPSPPDDEILLCPPKGGLAPYQREGVVGSCLYLMIWLAGRQMARWTGDVD